MKTSEQRNKHGPQKTANAAASAAVPQSRRRWLFPLLCLICAAVGTWALFEFVIWSPIPAALAGTWVVDEGEQEGNTFEFSRRGTMIGRINMQGQTGKVDARVRADGDVLFITTRHPQTGESMTRTQRIQNLTDRELVLEDDRGQVLKLTRVN